MMWGYSFRPSSEMYNAVVRHLIYRLPYQVDRQDHKRRLLYKVTQNHPLSVINRLLMDLTFSIYTVNNDKIIVCDTEK